jgi:hypothetical protein
MFQELFPILTTGDLPRALGFYRDLRGYGVPVLAEPARSWPAARAAPC